LITADNKKARLKRAFYCLYENLVCRWCCCL